MKKVNKLIGLLVAFGGVIASFATAAALYTKSADSTGFSIGSATWHGQTGTITYKISGATTGTAEAHYLDADGHNGGLGLGGEYTQVSYEFPLSATFGSGLIAQQYVMGNVYVKLSNINSALHDASKVYIDVDGYKNAYYDEVKHEDVAASYGYQTYRIVSDNVALSGATYEVDKNIAVKTAGGEGGQTLRIYIKLDSAISGEDLLAIAEQKVCDIDVYWRAPQNYILAHVVGNLTSYNEDEAYAMVPNIGKPGSDLEWMFEGITGFDNAKCRKGNTWSKGYYDDQSQWHENHELNKNYTYDFYWNGSDQSCASLVEHQS